MPIEKVMFSSPMEVLVVLLKSTFRYESMAVETFLHPAATTLELLDKSTGEGNRGPRKSQLQTPPRYERRSRFRDDSCILGEY